MVQLVLIIILFNSLVRCSGTSLPYIIDVNKTLTPYPGIPITLRVDQKFTVHLHCEFLKNCTTNDAPEDIYCLGPDRRNTAIEKTGLTWISDKKYYGLQDNVTLVTTRGMNGNLSCTVMYKNQTNNLEFYLNVVVIGQGVNVCASYKCGPRAECTEDKNLPTCSCLQNFIGEPPFCKSECLKDFECSQDKACVNRLCIDACLNKCGQNTVCRAVHHTSECSCKSEYYGNPNTGCSLSIPSSYVTTSTKRPTTIPSTTSKKEEQTTTEHEELKGEVLVNNEKVKTNDNQHLVYRYREGELATISCQKQRGMMHAEFYRTDTSSLFKTKDSSFNYTMSMKLTEQHHSKIFTCSIMTKHLPNTTYSTIKLEFEMENITDINEPVIKVNGLILVPDKNTITNSINYKYSYYDGETLHITGETSNNKQHWNCIPRQNNKQLSPIINQTQFIDVTAILKLSDNYTFIDCKVGEYRVSLMLVPTTPIINPAINGLSSAHLLYEYTDSPTNIIVYQNPGSKPLTLACINKDGNPQEDCSWSNPSNDNNNITVNKNIMMYSVTPLGDLSSYLICTCGKKQNISPTKVIINNVHAEPEIVEETAIETDTIAPEILPSTNTDGPLGLFELLGIIGGTLLVVVLVAWIIIGIHKRKQRLEQEQASDINYENLPPHNEGTMTTPAVWDQYSLPLHTEDTYTYCEPHLEKNDKDMNAKRFPAHQRPPPMETDYAEIGAQNEGNYASITPKDSSEVRNEPKTEYANLNEPAYSQIQPKRLRAPQVLPKMDEYAKVLPKSVRNNLETHEYDNLFESQQYANAKAKAEYAEPAYCEINLKKSK